MSNGNESSSKVLHFPFHYGDEADSYSFYRIPKILFTDPVFDVLSTDAKLLYGILLDRMQLSMKNGWMDRTNLPGEGFSPELDELRQDIEWVHRPKKKTWYLNVAASFDIETTSFYNQDGEKRACMYVWMVCIHGKSWYIQSTVPRQPKDWRK